MPVAAGNELPIRN